MIMRDREYNLASQTLGTPLHRVIQKNILPYLISVIVTQMSRSLPAFISSEVFLSYIGVGLGANIPSLGRIISTYTSSMTTHPYLLRIPVGVLALVSVSLYIVGQTLADASDPRTHM
ncbi:ABC transporter permease subunit [Erysipelothrix sp. D19-032]